MKNRLVHPPWIRISFLFVCAVISVLPIHGQIALVVDQDLGEPAKHGLRKLSQALESSGHIVQQTEAVDSLGNGCMIPDLEREMPYMIVETGVEEED